MAVMARRPEHYPLEETCTIRLCGKTRLRARRKVKPQGLALICGMVFCCLNSLTLSNHIPPATQLQAVMIHRSRHSYLQQFETLAYPLAKSKLVAIYFGASYCPENRLLRDAFLRDERLLPQEGFIEEWELVQNFKYDLSIVYVASDNVEGSSEWIPVAAETERNKLRQLFRIEQKDQDTISSHPIPSLFVIDSTASQIMTPMGLVDVKEKSRRALDKWLAFQSSIAGLDPKEWASPELLLDREEDNTTVQQERHQ